MNINIISISLRVALAALFFLVINYQVSFDVQVNGFDVRGTKLILYHLSRIALLFFVIMIAIGAGNFLLFMTKNNKYINNLPKLDSIILLFFIGSTFINFFYAFLGIFGLINNLFSLLFSIFFLYIGLNKVNFYKFHSFINYIKSFSWVQIFFLLVIFATSLLFLSVWLLYLPNPDNNIWEHYQHYYSLVNKYGSTMPNEVWHHFYNSKSGGLIFLVNSVSDIFGVQVVSTAYAFFSVLIFYSIIKIYIDNKYILLLSFILYVCMITLTITSGAMYRVHAYLLGYYLFSYFLILKGNIYSSSIYYSKLVLLPVLFIGYYQPVSLGILSPSFILLYIFFNKPNISIIKNLAFKLFFVSFLGVLIGFVQNYIITGLPDITPMRLVVNYFDYEKAITIFGDGGFNFFLNVANDLPIKISLLDKLILPFRPGSLSVLFVLLISTLILIKINKINPTDSIKKILFIVFTSLIFVIPVSFFSLFLPSPSIFRAGLYTQSFLCISIVLLLYILYISIDFKIKFYYLLFIIPLYFVFSPSIRYIKNNRSELLAIYSYVIGKSSTEDIVKLNESIVPINSIIPIDTFNFFRSIVGHNEKLLILTYNPGYGYFFLGKPALSEPTYSIIRDSKYIKSASSEEIVKYLRNFQINYLVINLNSRLFSNIVFSNLFSSSNFSNNSLKFIARIDNTYLISINPQDSGIITNIDFYQKLDIKRNGLLFSIFSYKPDVCRGFIVTQSDYLSCINHYVADLHKNYQNIIKLSHFKDGINNPLKLALDSSINEFISENNFGYDDSKKLITHGIDGASLSQKLDKSFKVIFLNKLSTSLGSDFVNSSINVDDRTPFLVGK